MAGLIDGIKNKTVSSIIEAAMSRAGEFDLVISANEVGDFLQNKTVSFGKNSDGDYVISVKKKSL